MATAPASRLLPKIVHPATQMNREDHGKITIEARKLTSATPGPRSARGGRPHSCPEMSVENLLTSARLTSSRLRHTRTCSARQQRGQGSVMGGGGGGGHRLPQFSTTEEVSIMTQCVLNLVSSPGPFPIPNIENLGMGLGMRLIRHWGCFMWHVSTSNL